MYIGRMIRNRMIESVSRHVVFRGPIFEVRRPTIPMIGAKAQDGIYLALVRVMHLPPFNHRGPLNGYC